MSSRKAESRLHKRKKGQRAIRAKRARKHEGAFERGNARLEKLRMKLYPKEKGHE